jgi:hypothetical protein
MMHVNGQGMRYATDREGETRTQELEFLICNRNRDLLIMSLLSLIQPADTPSVDQPTCQPLSTDEYQNGRAPSSKAKQAVEYLVMINSNVTEYFDQPRGLVVRVSGY